MTLETFKNSLSIGKVSAMPAVFVFAILAPVFAYTLQGQAQTNLPGKNQVLSKIAFGSCLKQENSLSIFDSILKTNPDLFVFGGDNVYADTTNEIELKKSYETLGLSNEYKSFSNIVPVAAIWDDHDYGVNDGGSSHPTKEMSQRVFLDFFNEPADSKRRKTPGIYTSYQFGPPSKKINMILLDTRYFRSKLERKTGQDGKKHYVINRDENATILGSDQWAWLEKELERPAKITIIVSSIQVISDKHRFEKWGNFPNEREKLFELISKNSRASKVVIVSGDRHFSELSMLPLTGKGNVFEITSSGMNHGGNFGKHEENPYRITWSGQNGFSLLRILWGTSGPDVYADFLDNTGKVLSTHQLK